MTRLVTFAFGAVDLGLAIADCAAGPLLDRLWDRFTCGVMPSS